MWCDDIFTKIKKKRNFRQYLIVSFTLLNSRPIEKFHLFWIKIVSLRRDLSVTLSHHCEMCWIILILDEFSDLFLSLSLSGRRQIVTYWSDFVPVKSSPFEEMIWWLCVHLWLIHSEIMILKLSWVQIFHAKFIKKLNKLSCVTK
jgi:hypothetical protein